MLGNFLDENCLSNAEAIVDPGRQTPNTFFLHLENLIRPLGSDRWPALIGAFSVVKEKMEKENQRLWRSWVKHLVEHAPTRLRPGYIKRYGVNVEQAISPGILMQVFLPRPIP